MTIDVSANTTATPTTIAVSASAGASVLQTTNEAPTTIVASPSVGPVVDQQPPTNGGSPTPTANKSSSSSSEEVIADATCVEFLHLMKAFSESAVNVTEMAQRVDSLVHQDEQLLRLLPLATSQKSQQLSDTTDDASGRGSTAGSVVDTTDDESSSSAGRARVDTESDLALALKLNDEDLDLDVDVDMDLDLEEDDDDDEDEDDVDDDDAFNSEDLDMLDDEDFLDESDGASTDADTRSISQRMGSVDGEDEDEDGPLDDQERRAQEDLQRWMELELDLDSTEDPYDASLHLPGVVEATLQSATASPSTTTTPSKPVSSSLFGNVHAASLSTTAGSHANSSSVLSTTAALASNTSSHRFRSLAVSSAFDRKSVTAALFEDDDEDDDAAVDDLVVLSSLTRKKDAASKSSLVGTKRRLEDTQESKSEDDVQAGSMWGMEVDSYEQDLLSSIDHAVLCDRENRFLQWDLEIEAATAAAAAAAAVSQKAELRTPPATLSTATTTSSFLDVRQKMLTASSPRERKVAHQPLRSPSNVDTNLSAEDWGSLDFGTFQNRTVSHILSSCLHKRKLHHPYKDRVTLVNFNVPGGEPIGPLPNHSATPSLAGSLLFGAGFEAAEALGIHGHGTAVLGLLSANGVAAGKDSKLTKSGEKKPKKPRAEGERKKAHKSDPFADFDAFGNDVEARKLAMTKLENLPLPDLTNLPNDLKELKRKIEATEHKVEGTKHRHRKGGPCPRCQVQNQLRAAKRAYHKRAVAHKKLPQLGAVSPALTATAVVVSAPTPAPAQTVLSTASGVSPPVSSTESVAATPPVPVTMATAVASITAALDASKASALKVPAVAAPATVAAVTPTVVPASVVRPATVPVVKDAPVAAAPTAVTTAPAVAAPVASSLVGSAVASVPTASPAVAITPASAPYPRRSCGENALSSPFSTPSSVPSSSSAPSSPESSPPPVHHVTVTSA